jgi:peptidyl-Asp metalloendopeptidase
MKLNTLVASLFLAIAGQAMAADSLFSVASNREQIANPGPFLRQVASDPANARIETVAVNADLVSGSNAQIALSLPGGIEVVANQISSEVMPSGNEVWIGEIDMGKLGLDDSAADEKGTIALDGRLNTIIATRSGDTVLADIRIAGELFRLIPVDKGAHVLVEVDQSKFAPDEDHKGYADMMLASLGNTEFKPSDDTQVFRATSTIRVMVATGPAARAALSNVQQTVDQAFAEANQALGATNTEAVFQQAGSVQNFSQSESTNYTTMLSRLTNLSDGFYDTIGTARNNNAADLVAYIAPASSGLCGQAAGIGVSSSQAYFVMNPSCMTGNFTFVHEAGHLVGARHDNDPTTTPFSYGHGYVMRSISRRTIMAVNSNTCCTRIGAFSSPNYTSSGVAIGTAATNDNNRVWRARAATVAGFR